MADIHEGPESNEQADTTESTPEETAEARASRERRADASARRFRRIVRGQQWREEFPYRWRADDLVTRRDTLRFLVAGSGALFVATTTLAAVGTVRSTPSEHAVAVARIGELAEDEWRVFNYPDEFGQGILVNLPGKGLVAYSDVCTHLSCAVLYQAEDRKFHCPCHEGFFDAYTGDVLAGPPTRPLPVIELRTTDGVVYAVREVER
jgi:nitrite reductase/ring-hydroxylating ferredoxin subunit